MFPKRITLFDLREHAKYVEEGMLKPEDVRIALVRDGYPEIYAMAVAKFCEQNLQLLQLEQLLTRSDDYVAP